MDFDIGFQRAIYASLQMHNAMTRAVFGGGGGGGFREPPRREMVAPRPAPMMRHQAAPSIDYGHGRRPAREIQPTQPNRGGAAGHWQQQQHPSR